MDLKVVLPAQVCCHFHFLPSVLVFSPLTNFKQICGRFYSLGATLFPEVPRKGLPQINAPGIRREEHELNSC